MRGRNLRPARVYQAATRLLETQAITQPPPWYTTIGSVPPGEILTRTQPTQHRDIKVHVRARKPSKLFRPQYLEYEEDQLRKEFYKDHPWELARPRIVLEVDGKDAQGQDWSTLRQKGKSISGENVIQRQLWLMNNVPGMTKDQAYDKARKEFYALRHQEEVEKKVQREEALWMGAQFGKSALEVGMKVEDKEFEAWKVHAKREILLVQTRQDAAHASSITEGDEEEAAEDLGSQAVAAEAQ